MAVEGHDPATRQDLRAGFAEVGLRFAEVDQRFAEVEQRFDQVDQRFVALMADLDQRFTAVDARFSSLEAMFERRLSDAVTTQTRTLVLSQLAALVAIAALAFGLG